jgi:ABC-2 type transport system permease protein
MKSRVSRIAGVILDTVLGTGDSVAAGLRMFWVFVRLGVLHESAYRVNFLVQLVSSGTNAAATMLFLAVVYARTDTLAGWRPAELLALWGVFSLLTGLLGTVVQPSLQRLIEDVRLGTLDFALTKPVDAQVLVSIREVQLWRLVDALLGIGLLAFAGTTLRTEVGAADAAGFLVALVAGGAILYCCCLILAALTFWFGRVENVLLVLLTFWEAGRWPVAVYPPWLRATLTFVVPIALASTVPAQALVGRLTASAVAGTVAIASTLLLASRWLWLRGLRHYSGASS